MISFKAFLRGTALSACLLLWVAPSLMAANDQQWRAWTSADGASIEAYLKEVRPDGIVIVRRDGQTFTVSPERFSEADRAYMIDWMARQKPGAQDFRSLDFSSVDLPATHSISGIPHIRSQRGEPPEAAAARMVLSFHNIVYDDDLANRISVRTTRERVIQPRDLTNAFQGLALETEVIRSGGGGLNAIRKAISMDLPVIVAHRPLIEEDTAEFVAVATGYDRRNLEVLEPEGSRRTVRLDLRDLEETLLYALVIFPAIEPPAFLSAPATRARPAAGPDAAFLSRISRAIREAPEYDPAALTDFFGERGINATRRDVNHSDYANQLGMTRSFARQGGIPQIEVALDGGSLVVVPQEFDGGGGFALLYGQTADGFSAVEFLPDRSFNRGALSPTEIASRWLTRENRTYRLDLIQISVPAPPPAERRSRR